MLPLFRAKFKLPPSFRSRFSSSVSQPNLSQSKPKTHKLRNTLITTTSIVGVGYLADNQFNSSALTRTARTGFYGALMAIDFKLNFNPENSESIDQLHERVAWRIHHICVTNGGLYIKLAQSIALQASILPKPYRDAFATIFDQAPQISYEDVVKVFTSEFNGISPDEAFESFSHEAIASASIAQVHKARLRRKPEEGPYLNEEDGWVAVKIRKPAVPQQLELDLFAYRTLLKAYEYLFDLPVAFVAEYVSTQMRREVDLAHEGKNAERMAEYLANSSLRDKVFVPKVYWEWTGTSVMTADFVSACKLTDKEALAKMGLSIKTVMDTATEAFAAMTFSFGFVHADPHPGNILVRVNKRKGSQFGQPEIVLIDHGLCIPLSESFRQDYSLLWRSLFVGDVGTIERIGQSWGIRKDNADMLASATLLRPHKLRRKVVSEDQVVQTKYEQQTGLKDRLRAMLENEQLIPRELIFLARGMRMMQGNNQTLGSPSNRINILAAAAAAPLTHTRTVSLLHPSTIKPFIWEKTQLVIFKLALIVIDLGFKMTQIRQYFYSLTSSSKNEGFEDLLQRQMTELARAEYGVELDDSAFQG